jgi:acyl carrier protein
MMNFVMLLEQTYGIDFDTIDFEVAVVDTVEAILVLIQPR